MSKEITTKASKIFFIDPTESAPVVRSLCSISITLGKGDPSEIDTTTLCEEEQKTSVDGLLSAASSTLEYFTSQENNDKLYIENAEGNNVDFSWVLRTGAGKDPTYTGGKWTIPKEGIFWGFSAHVSKVELGELSIDSVVTQTATLKMASKYKRLSA